jgi:plastocyanin
MTDWDLLTPGIGLTSIGIVGVGISLSGIAKTFLDGMHAVSLLAMFIGMIFLASGLFKDGFPTSSRAKSATFITLGLLVTFGFAAAVTGSTQTPSIFAYIGVMLLISIPAAVLVVASYKRTPYFRTLAIVFIGAAIVGGSAFYAFGLITPKAPSAVDKGGEKVANNNNNQQGQQQQINKPAELTKVSILPGASAEGNPSYDPKILNLRKGVGIQWINNDNVPHTVTSLKDDGKTFDSSIIMPKGNYTLDTSTLQGSEFDYFCTIHPYMKAKFAFGSGSSPAATTSGPSNVAANSTAGNISMPISGQAANTSNQPTGNTTSIGNVSNRNSSSIEGLSGTAKNNNNTNQSQVANNANNTSITTNSGLGTGNVAKVSIASGSSLPSNKEFFIPKLVETTLGSMVTWTNDDFSLHTVTSGNANAGKSGVFDSNIIKKGGTFSFVFDKIGEYNYFCSLHPYMTGKVIVK